MMMLLFDMRSKAPDWMLRRGESGNLARGADLIRFDFDFDF